MTYTKYTGRFGKYFQRKVITIVILVVARKQATLAEDLAPTRNLNSSQNINNGSSNTNSAGGDEQSTMNKKSSLASGGGEATQKKPTTTKVIQNTKRSALDIAEINRLRKDNDFLKQKIEQLNSDLNEAARRGGVGDRALPAE